VSGNLFRYLIDQPLTIPCILNWSVDTEL